MTHESLAEKYRPQTLSELVGQDIVPLKGFVDDYRAGKASMPNLFFAGPPGTGKTTSAQAIARELFGEGWEAYTLELNASDERGIDVIRERIIGFAKTSTMGQLFNLVILDECDYLTKEAQAALRVPMEKYKETCRFILCCNEPTKVIQALIDRCWAMQFAPIDDEQLGIRLHEIASKEGIVLSPADLDVILRKAKGSMRRALNFLGRAQDPVPTGEAGVAIDLLYGGKVLEAEGEIVKILRMQPSSSEVFNSMFDRMRDLNRPNKELYTLGEYEYRVLMGGSLELQVRCLLRHLAHMGGAK